jgi:hypothetical protein
LQQRLKDLTPVDAGQFGRLLGQLLQRLLFALRFQGREDSFAGYEVTKLHLLSRDTGLPTARSCLIGAVARRFRPVF